MQLRRLEALARQEAPGGVAVSTPTSVPSLPGIRVGDTVRIIHWEQGQTRKDEVGQCGPVVGFTRRRKVLVDLYNDGGKPVAVWPRLLRVEAAK